MHQRMGAMVMTSMPSVWTRKAIPRMNCRSFPRTFGGYGGSSLDWRSTRSLVRSLCTSTLHDNSAFAKPTAKPCSWTRKYQYLSVYNYVPIHQDKIDALHAEMRQTFLEMSIRGRIYLAAEGINGQLVVPQDQLERFANSFPAIFTPQQLNLGSLLSETRSRELFEKLDLRKRRLLVNDGAKEEWNLDLTKSGTALKPSDWHQTLGEHLTKTQTAAQHETEDTLVLDVRNFYEHDVGRFDGATRIMVDTFKDTYKAIDEILSEYEDNKPSKVMMYCTGGIRCEKIGAYMQQVKGIPQVYKLKGGIVNYVSFLKQNPQVQSLFKGKNFVFDQRCVEKASTNQQQQDPRAEEAATAALVDGMDNDNRVADLHGIDEAHVTDDILGKCYQCGAPCNQHINCRNEICHGLILQCNECATQFLGCCSEACKQVVLEMEPMDATQRRLYRKKYAKDFKRPNPNAPSSVLGSKAFVRFRPLPNHKVGQAACFSTTRTTGDYKTTDLESCLNRWTFAMQDHELLNDLRKQTIEQFPRPERMITPNQASLLCFLVQMVQATSVLELGCFTGYSAIALANGFPSTSNTDDTHEVLTCDIDAHSMKFARQHFAKSSHRHQIKSVVQSAQDLMEELTEQIARGDAKPFDVIFMDSNKKQYPAYYEQIIRHRLLAPNGLLVVDNTLFHGRVSQFAALNGSQPQRKLTSHEKLAQAVAIFNDLVAQDSRTRQILLPLYDGLTLVQYSPEYNRQCMSVTVERTKNQ